MPKPSMAVSRRNIMRALISVLKGLKAIFKYNGGSIVNDAGGLTVLAKHANVII